MSKNIVSKYGFSRLTISPRFSAAVKNCSFLTCIRAQPSYTLIRKSKNPIFFKISSAYSTRLNKVSVIAVSCGIRVARQAYAGLLHMQNPSSFKYALILSFVRPHILSGDNTDSSVNAFIPGLSDISSEAFVPSISISSVSYTHLRAHETA